MRQPLRLGHEITPIKEKQMRTNFTQHLTDRQVTEIVHMLEELDPQSQTLMQGFCPARENTKIPRTMESQDRQSVVGLFSKLSGLTPPVLQF